VAKFVVICVQRYKKMEQSLIVNLQSSIENWAATLEERDGKVVILCDGDVDGLGAGVVLWNFLERSGIEASRLVSMHTPKGTNPFTPQVREMVRAHNPAALAVLDLGIQKFALVPPGVPALLVDHHRPADAPDGALAISGYGWDVVPTSSLLTYLVCSRNEAKIRDKAWVAAIGNLGDLGPDDPTMTAAIKEQKQKYIREATSLLNAAKRCSNPDLATPAAFRALRDAASARELVESETPDLTLLREFKAEVTRELNEAKRAAPRFSKTENIALLRFDSPARVHPLLAQSWRGRLPKYVVMAANGGYMPGKVAFSIRTNVADANLLDLLARHGEALENAGAEYGHGHDKATGGLLSDANFARLLQSMGFSDL
jgi:single-stranded-DNA-specific exonuclease